MKNHFDIIILGAGISGLLIANELSKKFSIAIIEKENEIPRQKYWLTDKSSVSKNPELIHCIDSNYSSLDYIAYDQSCYRCNGDYYLWNTDEMINHLKNSINKNGSKIYNSLKFYSYRTNKNSITIYANDKNFSSKLLIDCMGYQSPLILAKGIIKILGFYILRGAILDLKKRINPIGLQNILINNRPTYLEVFPTQGEKAYTILIKPDKNMIPINSIYDDYKYIIENTYLKQYFIQNVEEKRVLGGIIPVGKQKIRALDRIFFFGESAQINPAATATGLTIILSELKKLTNFLVDNLKNNTLNKKDLEKYDFFYKRKFCKKFQFNLFRDILNWKSDDFARLIYQMYQLDDDLINKIVFADFNRYDIFSLKTFLKMIKNKNFIVLKPALRSIF